MSKNLLFSLFLPAFLLVMGTMACRAASLPLFATPTPTASTTPSPTLTSTPSPTPSITPTATQPPPTATPMPTLDPSRLMLTLEDLPTGARERWMNEKNSNDRQHLAEFTYYYPFADQEISGSVDLNDNPDITRDMDIPAEFFILALKKEIGEEKIIEIKPITDLQGIGDAASGVHAVILNPDRKRYDIYWYIFYKENLMCMLASISPHGKRPPADALEILQLWSDRIQLLAPLYFPQVTG